MTSPQALDIKLEQLVDRDGMHNILASLERICYMKADYLVSKGASSEVHPVDRKESLRWNALGKRFFKLIGSVGWTPKRLFWG